LIFSSAFFSITFRESEKCWWFRRQCLYAFCHDEKMISSFVSRRFSSWMNTNEWCSIIFALQ
jgi:hypothetical protein